MQPGLDDAHTDGMDIIERIKLQEAGQGVQHELRIMLRFHPHAAAAFEVDDLQDTVANDQHVASTEAAGHVL